MLPANTRTRTKYIHVNSRHRVTTQYGDKADMKIHLSQPIKNAYRVAVKSFTIANSFHNVRSGENTLNWVEFFKPVGGTEYKYKEFSISVPPGYYTAAELCLKISTDINALSAADHRVDSESPLHVNIEQHTDKYHITVKLTQSSGDKWFAAVKKSENQSLWSLLGITRAQMFPAQGYTFAQWVEQVTLSLSTVGADAVVIGLTGSDANLFRASTDSTLVRMIGSLPADIENAGGLYLTSDTLTTGSTYETRNHTEHLHTEAVPMNILEWIQFEVDRYSWVQHKADILHYHYLNNANLTDFDIQLRSVNGVPLDFKECGEFNLVLVFETIEEDEVSAEFIKAYNEEGYALAHIPNRLR